MAYKQPIKYEDITDDAIRDMFSDIAHRKEFYTTHYLKNDAAGSSGERILGGLRFHGGQVFLANFQNPNTPYERIGVNWQTGGGKSFAIIDISLRFLRQFKSRTAPIQTTPNIIIMAKSRALHEDLTRHMLMYPELGFIAPEELVAIKRLEQAALEAGRGSSTFRHYAGNKGALRRRITDKTRGTGYYQFYGYKEFAGKLFTVTKKGAEQGVSIRELYTVASKGDTVDKLLGRLQDSVDKGLVGINMDIVAQLRGGILFADEIHHVYNVTEKNNYGVAIQYVLDYLSNEARQQRHISPPRAVFLSATMAPGSATEYIDMLNLIIPPTYLPGARHLTKDEFFEFDGEVSKLKPGAAEKLGRLSAGRISYLLDSDTSKYPRREFGGEPIDGIPYLRFVKCPMSPLQVRTIEGVSRAAIAADIHVSDRGVDSFPPYPVPPIPIESNALLDMVYPNPEFTPKGMRGPAAVGLYSTVDTIQDIATAPEAWKDEVGVRIDMTPTNIRAVAGSILGVKRIGTYSSKYMHMMKHILELLRSGELGKIMIYHHWVQLSGVIQIEQILRENGLVAENEHAVPSTICAICGVPLSEHSDQTRGHRAVTENGAIGAKHVGANMISFGVPSGIPSHKFKAARYVIIYDKIDNVTTRMLIDRFNDPTNRFGHGIRVLVGSRKVGESWTFKAVRFLMVVSLPVNIPGYIQVLGRTVRHRSHEDLPPELRTCVVLTYVNTNPAGSPLVESPEVHRYRLKMAEYHEIQEIERATRIYAVDAFANYERIAASIPSLADKEATLDSLPYEPLLKPFEAGLGDLSVSTFEAYGYGDQEVSDMVDIIWLLFGEYKKVWTVDDLWANVSRRGSYGLGVDPALFDRGNFAIAVDFVLKHPRAVYNTDVVYAVRSFPPYLIMTKSTVDADIESYLRDDPPDSLVKISVQDYLTGSKAGENTEIRIAEFMAANTSYDDFVDSFLTYPPDLHYSLLTKIVEMSITARGPPDTYATLIDAYSRFKVLVTASTVVALQSQLHFGASETSGDHDAAENGDHDVAENGDRNVAATSAAENSRGYSKMDGGTYVGYVTASVVMLAYAKKSSRDRSTARTVEWYSAQRALFGIEKRVAENDVAVGYTKVKNGSMRFKLRQPMHIISKKDVKDARSIERGAVCETRQKPELARIISKLAPLVSARLRAALSLDPADSQCKTIRGMMLWLEQEARKPARGMSNGVRWVYIFNDTPPTLYSRKAKASKKYMRQ